MTKWKELKQQVLASTKQDSHGESNTKEFLELLRAQFSARKEVPLGQEHDIAREPVGFINNFAVIPSKNSHGHWNLVGDVYFHDVDIDDALRGFSYSAPIDIVGDLQRKELAAYISYPDYQDPNILENITTIDSGIVAGAWKKKSATSCAATLIVSFLLYATAPAYTNFWNRKVGPLFAELQKRFGKRHKIEFIQTAHGLQGEDYGIYFLPMDSDEGSLPTLQQAIDAIKMVDSHISGDQLAAEKGVYLVKIYYSEEVAQYVLRSVEYLDGSRINHNC